MVYLYYNTLTGEKWHFSNRLSSCSALGERLVISKCRRYNLPLTSHSKLPSHIETVYLWIGAVQYLMMMMVVVVAAIWQCLYWFVITVLWYEAFSLHHHLQWSGVHLQLSLNLVCVCVCVCVCICVCVCVYVQ